MAKRLTETDRILVSCTKNGRIWYMWHKALGTGPANNPVRCNYEDLASKLYQYAKQVGKIVE